MKNEQCPPRTQRGAGNNEQLFAQLKAYHGLKAVVVGIGQTLKADDGAGPVLCEKIKDKTSAKVIDAGTVPENYTQPIINAQPEILIIIDAIDFKGPVGAVKTFTPDQLKAGAISTHCLSPKMFIDMITDVTNTAVLIIGIQPKNIDLAQPLSPEVTNAINKLSEAIIQTFPKTV